MKVCVTVLLIALAMSMSVLPCAVRARAVAPTPADVDALHRPFDEILDIYVRDGLVYYFALKQERGKFDRYVQALGEVAAGHAQGLAARSAAGVLDQRLQRVRAAHGDRRLSDSRQGRRTIRRTASGRFPARSSGGSSAPAAGC